MNKVFFVAFFDLKKKEKKEKNDIDKSNLYANPIQKKNTALHFFFTIVRTIVPAV